MEVIEINDKEDFKIMIKKGKKIFLVKIFQNDIVSVKGFDQEDDIYDEIFLIDECKDKLEKLQNKVINYNRNGNE